jgi:predicted phosphodiesterase
MTHFAVISDIHSNRSALDAVFAAIDAAGIPEVVCLGDIIGYGPDPEYCVDLVRTRCVQVVRGNHDHALFHGASHFNTWARDALHFTRTRLDPRHTESAQARERWEWLRSLPLMNRRGAYLFIHGTPRDPLNDYLYADSPDLDDEHERARIFDPVAHIMFNGHTHVPCVISSAQDSLCFPEPGLVIDLDHSQKHVVNVGSVGQPRDGDPRASWVEVHDLELRFHRTDYDVEDTARRILATGCLDSFLAQRLYEGA